MLDGGTGPAGFSLESGRHVCRPPDADGDPTVEVLAWSATVYPAVELLPRGRHRRSLRTRPERLPVAPPLGKPARTRSTRPRPELAGAPEGCPGYCHRVMRRKTVVATAALIAALALAGLPGPAGSRSPSNAAVLAPAAFTSVVVPADAPAQRPGSLDDASAGS